MKRYSDPYYTTARFNSNCSVYGKAIKTDDSIIYDKYHKMVYCLSNTDPDCGSEVMRGLRAEKSMDQYGTDIY